MINQDMSNAPLKKSMFVSELGDEGLSSIQTRYSPELASEPSCDAMAWQNWRFESPLMTVQIRSISSLSSLKLSGSPGLKLHRTDGEGDAVRSKHTSV